MRHQPSRHARVRDGRSSSQPSNSEPDSAKNRYCATTTTNNQLGHLPRDLTHDQASVITDHPFRSSARTSENQAASVTTKDPRPDRPTLRERLGDVRSVASGHGSAF